MANVNKFVEVNGEIRGVIISETKETLLIRKGTLQCQMDGSQSFFASEKGVFVSKELLNNYWIKIVESSLIIDFFDMGSNRNFIREFLYM